MNARGFTAVYLLFVSGPTLLASQALSPQAAPTPSPQAAPTPSQIVIEGPKNITKDQEEDLSVKLVDGRGDPVESNSDITLDVDAVGANVNQSAIVIPKGQTAANLTVSKNTPGLSTIRVTETGTLGALTATTQIGLSTGAAYTPIAPYSLWVTAQPIKVRSGIESAEIIVRHMDKNKYCVPATKDISIKFPGIGQALTPHTLLIRAGECFIEGALSVAQPQIVKLEPTPSPAMSIVNEASNVEFVSPVASINVVTDNPSVKAALRRPKIPIYAILQDAQGNETKSECDRTIFLTAHPFGAGEFEHSQLTIMKGQTKVQTFFKPSDEGKFTIKAVAGGLPPLDLALQFQYTAVYFWLIAVIGGIVGGVVRNALGNDHSRKTVAKHVAGGAAVGVLTSIVAPLLVALSLKPAGLENGSKIFEAFIWGLLGGGSGVAILGLIFRGIRPSSQPSASQPSATTGAQG